MKITFFVSEDSVNPRISYLCSRGTWLDPPFPLARWKRRVNFFMSVFVAAVLVLYLRTNPLSPGTIAAIPVLMLLLLPLHEFSHVLYYVLFGNGVDTVRFYPDIRSKIPVFSRLGGCVFPSLAAYSRTEVVLAHLFPLFLLTFLPLVLCFIFPAAQPALIWLAIVNPGTACFDLCDAAAAIRMTPGAVKIGGSWFLPEDDAPYIIYRFRLAPDHRTVEYHAFRFEGKTIIALDNEPMPPDGTALIEDFRVQFGLES
ncbi:MAG: DUF3267 domain-containing protein [Clostridia bacterium]|nr:DUF3267 domain-containing protein [Clostridia bacterium]